MNYTDMALNGARVEARRLPVKRTFSKKILRDAGKYHYIYEHRGGCYLSYIVPDWTHSYVVFRSGGDNTESGNRAMAVDFFLNAHFKTVRR